MFDKHQGVHPHIGHVEALREFLRQLALHWGKCKGSLWVSLDDEIHCAVTEVANTIEYDDMGVVHRLLKELSASGLAIFESLNDENMVWPQQPEVRYS
tara:strand:- start:94 stop:387 length:294 start_codon:yes stop_codon:yes gene_type:complete